MPSSPTTLPATPTRPEGSEFGWRPTLTVVVLTLATLAPYLGKAVHVDDYLFIRSARQIIEHPLDPFGTTANWYGFPMPLSQVTQNPPGACYLLAAAIAIGGENEIWLHTVFLIPAVLAALGILALSRRLCDAPVLATAIAVITPVFWLSATTLMCDVSMLACWIWSTVWWIRGMDTGSHRAFAGSALLIAAAALTKYFGASLLPLLLAYSLVRHKRPGWFLLWLALPVALLWGYEHLMAAKYGRGLLAAAGEYANTRDKPGATWQRLLTTAAFVGGCVLPVLFPTPGRSSLRRLALAAGLAAGLAALLAFTDRLGVLPLHTAGGRNWAVIAQVAILAVGGVAILSMVAEDLWHERSAESLLLALWVAGTVVFTGVLNWTINGRSLLPLAPAVALLWARRIGQGRPPHALARWKSFWPLLPAAALAALVVAADASLANQSRVAAAAVHEKLGSRAPIWFQGHWGFQYYMERAGARPLDKKRPAFKPGDYLITPEINTNLTTPPEHIIETFGSVEVAAPTWIATMNIEEGVGFYSDSWGPLPFGFIGPHGQRFDVARVRIPQWQFR